MKGTYTYFSRLTLFLFLVIPFCASAQNNWLVFSTVEPATITVCQDTVETEVTVSNTHTSAVAGIEVTLDLPPGVFYVPGSATAPAAEVDIANLNAPVISVPDIATSASVVFNYATRASCDLIAFANGGGNVQDTLTANYTGGFDDFIAGNYNMLYASLSFNSITNQSYSGAPGDVFSRTFTIVNGGNGALSQPFDFRENWGAGLTVISAGGATVLENINFLTTGEMTVDTSIFRTVGNNDSLFDPGEQLIVSVTYRIEDCASALGSEFYVDWSCQGSPCQSEFSAGNVVIPPNPPTLTFNDGGSHSSCFDLSIANQQFLEITNTGIGPATNLVVDITSQNWQGATTIDTSSMFYTLNGGGINFPITVDSTLAKNFGSNRGCLDPANGNTHGSVRTAYITLPELLPGDTYRIHFDLRSCCDPANCNNTSRWAAWGSRVFWSDECENTQYQNLGTGGRGGVGVGLGPASVAGPANLTTINPNGCYSVELSAAEFNWGEQFPWQDRELTPTPFDAGAYLEWTINLPANVSITPGSIEFVDFDGTVWAPSSITLPAGAGGTAVARFDLTNDLGSGSEPAGFEFTGASLNYCISAACGASGVGQLQNNLVLVPNPSCACPIQVICRDYDVSVNCPEPCPTGGMVYLDYQMQRANIGEPDDAPYDNTPDGPGTAPNARVDRLAYGDTLVTSYTGVVAAGSEGANWQRGHAVTEFTFGNHLTPTEASVRIVDMPSGNVYVCDGIPVVVNNTGGNNREYVYTFSPAVIEATCPGLLPGGAAFTLSVGDTVTVESRYQATDYAAWTTRNLDATTQFYLSNDGSPGSNTATTQPPIGERWSCGSFTGSATLYGINQQTWGSGNNNFNACEVDDVSITINWRVGTQQWGDVFTSEFRDLAQVDSIVVYPAPGWTYAGDAQYRYRRLVSPGESLMAPDWTGFAPSSITPDSIVFNIRDLMTTHGGTVAPAEHFRLQVRYDIQPSCEVQAGPTSNEDEFDYNVYWDFSSQFDGVSVNEVTNHSLHNLYHDKPSLELSSPLPVVEALDSFVNWELRIENNSAIANANYTWISLLPPAGISIQSVTDLASSTDITANAGGLFELGTVPAAGSSAFNVEALYASCSRDSIMVLAGWNCPGYPADVATYPCTPDTFYLVLVPQDNEIQVTLISEPGATVDLCDEAQYEVRVANVQPGTSFDNVFAFFPTSAGLTPVNGTYEVEYPAGSGFVATTMTPAQFGNVFLFDMNEAVSVLEERGLRGIRQPDSNSFRFRFEVETDCNYTSGAITRFYAGGYAGCGSFSSNYIAVSPIELTGAATNYNAAIADISLDTIRPCEGGDATARVSIVNLGPAATGSDDYFRFRLPATGTLVPGSGNGINNAPASLDPTSSTTGSIQQLEWQLPAGVASGDSVVFEFDLDASGMACGEAEFDVSTVVTSSLTCVDDLSTCQISVSTSNRLDTFSVGRADLDMTALGSMWVAANGVDIDFNFTNVGDSINGTIQFDYYLDVDGSGTFTPGDQYLGSGNSTGDLNPGDAVSQEDYHADPGWPPSDNPDIIVRAEDTNNPCLCETEELLIANIGVLPVNFLGFDAQLQTDGSAKLFWDVIQDGQTSHYRLQRSAEGVAFNDIALIDANNTQNEVYRYNHVDPSVPAGKTYYRVIGVDYDGKTSYSNVAEILRVNDMHVKLYPNPTTATVQVSTDFDISNLTIMVYDLNGKRVTTPVLSQTINTAELDLRGVANGSYIISVEAPNGRVQQVVVKAAE